MSPINWACHLKTLKKLRCARESTWMLIVPNSFESAKAVSLLCSNSLKLCKEFILYIFLHPEAPYFIIPETGQDREHHHTVENWESFQTQKLF